MCLIFKYLHYLKLCVYYHNKISDRELYIWIHYVQSLFRLAVYFPFSFNKICLKLFRKYRVTSI
jgi:hypothetical protein